MSDPLICPSEVSGADLKTLVRPDRTRVPLITPGMIGRLVFAAALGAVLSLIGIPSMARAETLRLRGDVTARGDVLTLADLVENAPSHLAARPLFRAPALGATGTIQARRIIEALEKLDLKGAETGGRVQIQVQRAARRIGPVEIEAALKRALATSHGLDPTDLAIRLDGEASLVAPVDLVGAASALDITYEPRSHRVAGLIVLGERQASLRVSGQVVETREVAVLTRALARGEAVKSADLALERRPREGLGIDIVGRTGGAINQVIGQVAQRSLTAGAPLRSGDTAPPDLVARGDSVTIVFETAGVSLSIVGLANESGRLGATIPVVNTASKKLLQGTVIGPGRVSVGPVRAPQAMASAETWPGRE